ncbi:EpsG family protein [Exiguobacterium sp. SH1S21]|uniref:EpsG family protein n=1 Tax=Exiguobacterium sp. SH1S21 TaxID=2510953 RepID=UPI001375C8FD
MLVYVSVSLILIILAFLFEIINSNVKLKTNRKSLPNHFFIIPSFLLLFIVSAFRGDFTTDYKNYSMLFHSYNRYSFTEVFQANFYQENGYIFLNKLIGLFTSNDFYLLIFITFIILYGFFHQFSKYSAYIWLSVLMFTTIGAYYTSFNTMRHILAVAIVFFGSKFLYERNLFKYCIVIIIASLFHRSALIMIVFYFILNFKFNIKNLTIILLGSIATMLSLNTILEFIQRTSYSVYTPDAYGMTGLSFTNAVLPIAILIFSLFYHKKIDLNNTIQKIWINAVVFYTVFSVLGLKVQMIQRIAEYFAPYALLLIPLIFSKMKNDELKVIYMMVFIFVLVLYNYIVLSGTGYDPYYFI